MTTTLAFSFFNTSGAILYDAPFAQSIAIVFPFNASLGINDIKNFSYCFTKFLPETFFIFEFFDNTLFSSIYLTKCFSNFASTLSGSFFPLDEKNFIPLSKYGLCEADITIPA